MPDLTIDGFDTFVLRAETPGGWKHPTASFVSDGAILVRVRTSAGLAGWGEPSPYGAPRQQTLQALAEIRELVVGRDIDALASLTRQDETRGAHQYGKTPWTAAVAGLSQALWDLRAQAAGVPLYRLLNPDAAPGASVRVYASGGMIFEISPRAWLADEAAAACEAGFTAWKFRPVTPARTGSHLERAASPPPVDVMDLIDTARLVRAAVGPNVDLMLDAGCRISRFDDAVAIGEVLSELNFAFFEEPMPREIAVYTALSKRLNVPVAAGECFFSAAYFARWIAAGALDVVQPDVNFAGIDEMAALGPIAQQADTPIAIHNWSTAVSAAANLHMAAALPACGIVEYNRTFNPFLTDLTREPLIPIGGRLTLPERPGLGIDIDERALARFAAQPA